MHRLPPHPTEQIDRTKTIHFTFDGKRYPAHPGDTIASALAANGVTVVARSFKYHRPRGLRTHGHSTNAMVQIGDRVSESMWLTLVEDGMNVTPIHVDPSLDNDWRTVTQYADRFLPIGWQYKSFIHPRRLWPQIEQFMRDGAGLGTLNLDAQFSHRYTKQYLHTDLIVVGAGPAGMSAALAAANAGATVLLCDENSFTGGHLAWSSRFQTERTQLTQAVAQHERITVLTNTLVQGWFEDQWLFAVNGNRLYKIRAKATIIATGAEEQPPIFDKNDLPGVMGGDTLRRLLHLYGTIPGKKVLVATANDDGWELAQELKAAGVEVVAVVDERQADATRLGSVAPQFARHVLVAARGNGRVAAAEIAPIHDLAQRETVSCDLIALSTAWSPRYDLAYLADCRFAFDEAVAEFRPISSPDSVFMAGRITGSHQFKTERLDGELAGRAAAAFVGFGDGVSGDEQAVLDRLRRAEPRRSSPHFRQIGDAKGKRFVDFDKDVTDKDVADSVSEGFNSIELLKRYTKISTGPSQGKWSSINAIRLLAELNGATVNETGKTTSRAPARPVKIGNLAGQHLEPERHTPIHQWHLAHGAKMMTAGLWMRPRHYGNVQAEVRAVRERVGLIDVSTLGKLRLTGDGVPALLNRLYVNKWSRLKAGRVRYGIMCNAEGVILDDGVTARVGERAWYMSTTTGGAQSIFEWIQWWAQSGWGDGVHVANVSEQFAAFNLAGCRSRKLLEKLCDAPLANGEFPYMQVRDLAIAGVPCRVMRIGFTGELSYEIHVPAGGALAVWEALMAAGRAFGIVPFGIEAQRILRLEKGHIIVGQDTDPLTDPFSADQAWSVKLDKDDFLGQRSLSRIAENGVRERVVGFKMENQSIVPEEGLQIVREVAVSEKHPIGLEIVGWVSSCAFSPTLNQTVGLCRLRADLAEREGTRFTIRRDGDLVEARVHHGAFFDPSGSRLRS